MTSESRLLIAELDSTLQRASNSHHLSMLRGVTELFVNGADAFADEHIAVFDDVIGRLIDKADRQALAELTSRLVSVGNAPANVIDRLARHDDIAVSGPILQKCNVKDLTLVEVAGSKGEKHLAAIAGRPEISEAVTDVLVGRCTIETARRITDNKGASLSEVGFVKLINRAKGDKALAAAIESREDLPPELQPFLKLTLE
ncbi:MAG: DUF2336 domain-containing protein [Xanthobacteraceae bacterium]|nr:DUF2336 domain-containing protein [Xanthobacteraceae bacterium]